MNRIHQIERNKRNMYLNTLFCQKTLTYLLYMIVCYYTVPEIITFTYPITVLPMYNDRVKILYFKYTTQYHGYRQVLEVRGLSVMCTKGTCEIFLAS